MSSWVLLNNMGRWYFVASYISLSMIILLTFDFILNYNYPTKYFKIFLLFMIILGAISPVYTMLYTRPKTLKPMIKVVEEFETLGQIGIIGDYWNSYILSCTNPDLIKATPHDKSGVRSSKLVEEVFKQPELYIIRDMWFKAFPDTLVQFGFHLKKEGNEFSLGGCQICKYKRIECLIPN
jgi:hypothetical protein